MDRKSHKASSTFPELMVQQELIEFLRIPEITKAGDYNNVVENLKRMHDLPCIHICKQPLYPLSAVREWVSEKLKKEHSR
jgi:hypothetical protein